MAKPISPTAREDALIEALATSLIEMSGEDTTRLARVMVRQHLQTGLKLRTAAPIGVAIEVLDAMT